MDLYTGPEGEGMGGWGSVWTMVESPKENKKARACHLPHTPILPDSPVPGKGRHQTKVVSWSTQRMQCASGRKERATSRVQGGFGVLGDWL